MGTGVRRNGDGQHVARAYLQLQILHPDGVPDLRAHLTRTTTPVVVRQDVPRRHTVPHAAGVVVALGQVWPQLLHGATEGRGGALADGRRTLRGVPQQQQALLL